MSGRVGRAWRALVPDQRLAAIAALALLASMLLPWYQESGSAIVDGRLASIDDSKSAFGVYSFVEAAIFVVAIGTLALLWARAEGRVFHLPFGDGPVIMAAGLWVMLLVFYRQLDKPDGRRDGMINTSVGVQWGIFVAFVLGGLLAYAGYRIKVDHVREPGEPPRRRPRRDAAATAVARDPADDPTRAAPRDDDATRAAPAPERSPEPRPAPMTEAQTAVGRRRQQPQLEEPFEGQLSFDEPTEQQPPRE